MKALDKIEEKYRRAQVPAFNVGDTVDVHIRLLEGDKERTQVFTGTVIARRGSGARETFTVRRIVQGEGVERTFPLHSPAVTKIAVRRAGKVHRAKLYYLRKRVGKATRVEAADLRTDKAQAEVSRANEPSVDDQ